MTPETIGIGTLGAFILIVLKEVLVYSNRRMQWIPSKEKHVKKDEYNLLVLTVNEIRLKLDKLFTTVSEIKIINDTLKEVYILDALKQVRSSGMSQRQSKEMVTQVWTDMLSEPILVKMQESVKDFKDDQDVETIAFLIWRKFSKELKEIIISYDVQPSAVLGGLIIWIQQVKQ